MPRKLPPPLSQALVLCRQIFEQPLSHEFVLVSPLDRVRVENTPHPQRFSVYMHLSGGHGKYKLELVFRDSRDKQLWNWVLPDPIDLSNPVEPHQIALYDIVVHIPEIGRYQMILFAEGEEISRQSIEFYATAQDS